MYLWVYGLGDSKVEYGEDTPIGYATQIQWVVKDEEEKWFFKISPFSYYMHVPSVEV